MKFGISSAPLCLLRPQKAKLHELLSLLFCLSFSLIIFLFPFRLQGYAHDVDGNNDDGGEGGRDDVDEDDDDGGERDADSWELFGLLPTLQLPEI